MLPTKEQVVLLRQSMTAFNRACNFVSAFAFERKAFNKYDLQDALYAQIRKDFSLPSQMAVRVFAKVSHAYKTEATKAKQKERSISQCRFKIDGATVYDARLLTYGKDNTITIKTLEKRLTMAVHYYDETKLPFFKGEADLVAEKGEFFLLQTLTIPDTATSSVSEYIGADLGMVQILTDSDGQSYCGKVIDKKRQQYSKHRQSVKAKKTVSSRRRLAKIGKKESSFRRDVNHVISKRIVEKAIRTCRGIALEDLEQFFDKKRVRQKQRASRSSWSFFQLRSFINYKAKLSGVPVILVDPSYTSQRCSVCEHIAKGNRKDQEHFCCLGCGHAENADFNASKNIKALADNNLHSYRTTANDYRGAVNLPEASGFAAGGDVVTLRGPIRVPVSAASHTPCGCGR